MKVVHLGKLIDRRYKGAIPLCILPACDCPADGYTVDNAIDYYSGYYKYCVKHEKVFNP